MENESLNSDLVSHYNNVWGNLLSNELIREINSFQGNSNPCCEIELPKEKKSEKPRFNQTKK